MLQRHVSELTKAAEGVAETRHQKVRCACMWALADMLSVLDQAGLWLTPDEQARAHSSGLLHMQCYQYLAAEALAARICNYKMRPKWHYVSHVVWRLAFSKFNVRFQHCFQDEDFMGKLARLCGKVHRSSQLLRLFQRYILLLSVRFNRRKTMANPKRKAKLCPIVRFER